MVKKRKSFRGHEVTGCHLRVQPRQPPVGRSAHVTHLEQGWMTNLIAPWKSLVELLLLLIQSITLQSIHKHVSNFTSF